MTGAPLVVAPEVAQTLARKGAVVALESTIVSHGLPYPQNLETARALESTIRALGAVPATIAVIAGHVRIGVDDAILERLATSKDAAKLSSADLPYAVAARKDGATTVAATMICARLAGIAVFATGGIGGVHRGAEKTYDVSADLTALAQTPVAVVCSGAKALLDVRKTLEMLETLGVPVICYRSAEFPAFWSRGSGLPAPLRIDAVDEIANFITAQRRLGLDSGTLVANPVPEKDAIPFDEMSAHIEAAIGEAEAHGIGGKAVTPFLLERIAQRTNGRSIATNIELVNNNARLAALLAIALAGR